MKKLFILIAVCGLALGTATSCKKARNCVCTSTDGDTETFPIPSMKKKDAKTVCEADSGDGWSCKLD